MILASASPQRRAILEQLGIEFEVRPSQAEELTEGDPRFVVLENARRKANAVEGDCVLACDTEVSIDGRVLGKPGNPEAAREMLTLLAGRMHEVLGGLILRCTPQGGGQSELTAIASTRVYFRDLDGDEIAEYVETGEWEGRAGGYAIQGRGAALVERINGDFWNVVGLPVPELVRLLKSPC